MNLLDYASFEASKRLVENEIVLETECRWHKFDWGINGDKWGIYRVDQLTKNQLSLSIPAPCMAEVWRELPEHITRGNKYYELLIAKRSVMTSAYYYCSEVDDVKVFYVSDNPTDALIDLLIWVRKEKEGKG
jgi:hypothetical protein